MPTCLASPPQLSVIIPTLNEAGCLPLLLADLALQQSITLEIIIGDGGSHDATREIAAAGGARVTTSSRGRGIQMNRAAETASGEYLLFLHADSRLSDPAQLSRAVQMLQQASHDGECAGHFPLRFIRSSRKNELAYRYAENKSSLNRPGTTNGDQGLLLSAAYFRQLGGFDEGLPFLEDQRIAEIIRKTGRLITLPDRLGTSARRFEKEGLHQRYILMSMMMGLFNIGEMGFFDRAPHVYRSQSDTGRLRISPYILLIWLMAIKEWRIAGTVLVFYRLGRYIRQNSWQLFYFLDVLFRPRRNHDSSPLLAFHDRVVEPCINFKVCDALTGTACFIWFMLILFPYYSAVDLVRHSLSAQVTPS